MLRCSPLILALVFTACTETLPFEPAGPESSPDPSKMGPFSVGVTTRIEFDYNRVGLDGTGPRKLVTEIWYPAAPLAETQDRVSYNVEDVLPPELIAKLGDITLPSFETEAVRDALPNKAHGPYPVILFSHGSMSIRFQSTFLTVFLASHGYVVISPDHEGNTFAQLGEGNTLEIDDQIESLIDRPGDLLYYIDRYDDFDEGDLLHGLLDWEKIGVSGHSFGAVTTLRAAGLDSRIDAIAPQCPAGYSLTWLDIERRLEDLNIPVMVQMAEGDMTTPPAMAESIWEHVTEPGYYLSLKTAGHFTYSDLCLLGTETIRQAEEAGIGGGLIRDGCDDVNLEASKALPIIRNYTIGFFNHYLRDSPDSIQYLDAKRATTWAADEVELTSK